MRIYEFEVQDGYEWVVPVDGADFEAFRALDGTPRAAIWDPIHVQLLQEDETGRPLMSADLPWLGKHAPVLKETATATLGSILKRDGELLPLVCSAASLVVFNATRIVDALDLERSDVVRFPSSGRIMKVNSHVFRPDHLEDAHAFKVPGLLRGPVFVTDEVVAAAAGLAGVGFALVWEDSATPS